MVLHFFTLLKSWAKGLEESGNNISGIFVKETSCIPISTSKLSNICLYTAMKYSNYCFQCLKSFAKHFDQIVIVKWFSINHIVEVYISVFPNIIDDRSLNFSFTAS